jgi:hypothetical protein
MKYMCHTCPLIFPTCRKHFPPFHHPWLFTGFVTRLTRRVLLVEQELLTLPEHLCSPPPPLFLVGFVLLDALCVCFVDCCLSFFTFSFGYCALCSSSIYGIWLPLWHLQTLLGIEIRPMFNIMGFEDKCYAWGVISNLHITEHIYLTFSHCLS